MSKYQMVNVRRNDLVSEDSIGSLGLFSENSYTFYELVREEVIYNSNGNYDLII